MDELESQERKPDEPRRSVKELIAQIQQKEAEVAARHAENSESSDDDDSPLRMVQHQGPMGESNLAAVAPSYENVPMDAPRSRSGMYSPTIVSSVLADAKMRYIEPVVRVQEYDVRYSEQNHPSTSSGRTNNYDMRGRDVSARFGKLRMLDSSKLFESTKAPLEGSSRMLDSNKMFESTTRMLENTQDNVDRDTNNDSGYSTKVYGSSKGNSPSLSGARLTPIVWGPLV